MKPILDRIGKVIGYTHDVSEYRKEVRSPSNSLLGWYNPKCGPGGKTFDRNGQMIGFGDQRGRFIPIE